MRGERAGASVTAVVLGKRAPAPRDKRAIPAAVLLAAALLGAPRSAPAIGPTAVPEEDGRAPLVRPAAVFGADDRVLLPARLKALEGRIGLLYEPRSRSVCTAFCLDKTTVATAAHCLFRTRGERALPLSDITFRLATMGRRAGVPIAGAARGAAEQNIVAGTTSLSTRPPIDATRDWALVRLAKPVCRDGGLPLSPRLPAELSADATDRRVYQVGYHGDFGNWRLALSPPCALRRTAQGHGGRAIAGDFSDASALLLHTCDTGGASSGSPLLIDGPRGPEVIGVNVGTYLQSHVLTQAGEVVHRYRSDTVANTGVSARAFLDQQAIFARATVLSERSEIRRVQAALSATGHYRARLDGRYGPELRRAIEAFETDERRTQTGLASVELLRRLEAVLAERRSGPGFAPSAHEIETGSVPRPRPTGR